MSSTEPFDADKYRAELECRNDDTLFDEGELAFLTKLRVNALVEQYEGQLDGKDMVELYGHDEWARIRAARIEELISTCRPEDVDLGEKVSARSLDVGRERDLEMARSLRQEEGTVARLLDAGRQRDLDLIRSERKDEARRAEW